MTWAGFAAIFAAFFLTHSLPVRPALKSRLTAKVGMQGFAALYSGLSLTMLMLLIWSAGAAPFLELWSQLPWQRYVTYLAMLTVCLILALTIARPNPFSFGGARNAEYDPAHPGITRWMRHPVLIALSLWACAHIFPNGDLAHLILFGVLGAFAVAGCRLIDARKRRLWGEAGWNELDQARRTAPKIQKPASLVEFVLRLLAGLGVFMALLLAHPYVIGVPAI